MRPEFQDVVDEVSRLLGRPATLEDRDFNLVAFGSHGDRIDEVRLRSILQRHSTPEVRDWFESFGIATSEVPLRTPAAPDLGVLPRLCVPVRWRGVTYGYLWLLDEDDAIDAEQVAVAASLAERAGALLAQQARSREELDHTVADLLSSDAEARARAADTIHALGTVPPDSPVAVVVLRRFGSESRLVPVNLWRLPRSVLGVSSDEHSTLLVPVPDGDLGAVRDLARQARQLYDDRLSAAERERLVVGVGGLRRGLVEVRESWLEARLATRVADVVPSARPVAVWPELGVYRLLACGPERALSSAVLDPAVRRLIEHGDPDLRRTALAFLDAGGNVQEAAAALTVHRQTVYYRVQKIEQVTGLDLARGDHRLLLHLGLTMAPFVVDPADD